VETRSIRHLDLIFSLCLQIDWIEISYFYPVFLNHTHELLRRGKSICYTIDQLHTEQRKFRRNDKSKLARQQKTRIPLQNRSNQISQNQKSRPLFPSPKYIYGFRRVWLNFQSDSFVQQYKHLDCTFISAAYVFREWIYLQAEDRNLFAFRNRIASDDVFAERKWVERKNGCWINVKKSSFSFCATREVEVNWL
jgi:hypothetical protein